MYGIVAGGVNEVGVVIVAALGVGLSDHLEEISEVDQIAHFCLLCGSPRHIPVWLWNANDMGATGV